MSKEGENFTSWGKRKGKWCTKCEGYITVYLFMGRRLIFVWFEKSVIFRSLIEGKRHQGGQVSRMFMQSFPRNRERVYYTIYLYNTEIPTNTDKYRQIPTNNDGYQKIQTNTDVSRVVGILRGPPQHAAYNRWCKLTLNNSWVPDS